MLVLHYTYCFSNEGRPVQHITNHNFNVITDYRYMLHWPTLIGKTVGNITAIIIWCFQDHNHVFFLVLEG